MKMYLLLASPTYRPVLAATIRWIALNLPKIQDKLKEYGRFRWPKSPLTKRSIPYLQEVIPPYASSCHFDTVVIPFATDNQCQSLMLLDLEQVLSEHE